MSPSPLKKARARDRLPKMAEGVFIYALGRQHLEVRQIAETVRMLGKVETETRIYRVKLNPTHEELVAAAGSTSYRRRGYKMREYKLGNERDGKPAVAEIWRPWVEPWDAAAGKWGKRKICEPKDVDPELGILNDAVAWIDANFADLSLAKIERDTAVGYLKIRAIGERIVEADDEAMPDSDFDPDFLAADKLFMAPSIGADGGYINTYAKADGLRPVFLGRVRLWQDEVVEAEGRKQKVQVPKPKEMVIQEQATILARPPRYDALKGMAMDGEVWLADVMTAACEVAGKTRPGIACVPPVLDRWHMAHNAFKPYQAEITKTRMALPRGEAGRYERQLLGRYKNYLVKACWWKIASKDHVLDELTEVFERFPHLEEPFWEVKLFLEVLASPDLETGEARYAAWRDNLSPAMQTLFAKPLKYLKQHRAAMMTYFRIKGDTRSDDQAGLSVTSSVVESQNFRDKLCWRYARNSSETLLNQKSTKRAGIRTRLRQADLAKRWMPLRKRKKRRTPQGSAETATGVVAA